MGWTCSSAAHETLTQWGKYSTSNNLPTNNYRDVRLREYFWEVGRENGDGAITGTVWRYVTADSVRRAGGFRIEPDGSVSRWPTGLKRTFLAWFKCEFCEGVKCKPVNEHEGCICSCHVMKGDSTSPIPPITSSESE